MAPDTTPLENAARRPPRVFVWRVIQDCNLRCRFCSYANDVERQRSTASADDVARFGALLGRYQQETERPVLVSWIGGEPFLWPPLLDLSQRFVHEFGLAVSATTNGLPLRAKAIRKRIVDDFAELVISVDGIGEANDGPRQRPGLYAQLERDVGLLAEARAARGKPLTLKVNTILMRHNIEQFESFCNAMLDWGIQELTFNQLGGYDRPEFFPDNRLLPEQAEAFRRALPEWQRHFAQRGLVIHGGDSYLRRFLASTRDEKIAIDDCAPGAWFWFINENGLASPCSYTSYQYAVPLAAIDSVAAIDDTETRFRELRCHTRSPFCDDCHCTQLHDKFTLPSTP